MRYLLKFVAVASCLAVPALPLAAQQKKGGESPPSGFETKKPPPKFEINKEDKSVTIPLTRGGDYRFGYQDMSKEPTREIPQGEKGGVFFFEKRF